MKTNEEVMKYINTLDCSDEEKERIMRTVLKHTPKIEVYLKNHLQNKA